MLAHFYIPLLAGAAPAPGAAAVWGYTLPNGLTAGATLAAVHAMLRDLYRIHGLEVGMPLGVTATARTAGPIVQTIAEGGGTVTVERTA